MVLTEMAHPPKSVRRAALWAFQVIFVLGLCWVVVRNIDLAQLVSALREANFALCAVAIIPLLLERIIRPYRLFTLFGGSVPFRDVLAVQSVSQLVNLVLPMRSGEISLLVMLRGLGHSSVSYALSVVAIDRLLDVAVVLLIFAWAIIAVPDLPPAADKAAAALAIVCASAFAGMLLVSRFKQQVLAFAAPMITRLAGAHGHAWFRRLEALVDGLSVFSEGRKIGAALLASVATWGLATFASWLVLAAIWPKAPFAAVALGICLAALGNAIISVPAGIGVVHAANMFAVVMFGASQEIGLAYAVCAHAIVTAVTAVMGLIYLPIARRLGFKTLSQVRAES